jgi:hypothetical protein
MSANEHTLEDAERYQRLFVKPLVDTLERQISPIVDRLNNLDGRVKTLETSQKKALVGWGVYATGAAAALTWAWGFIKAKLHWG